MPKVKARKRVSIMAQKSEERFTEIRKTVLNVALCQGRHEIPQATDGFIFGEIANVTETNTMREVVNKFVGSNKTCQYYCGECDTCDEFYSCGSSCSMFYPIKINLYVTGLTVALVEVINYCHLNDIELTLYHFNRETNDYYAQEVY